MKKYIRNKKKLWLFLVTAVVLQSCLLDDKVIDYGDSPLLLQFKNATVTAKFILGEDNPTYDYDIPVRIAGGRNQPLSKDVTLNISTDTKSVAVEGNEFELLTKTVTIPAGETEGMAKIKVYSKNLDANLPTSLLLKITDASETISGNGAVTEVKLAAQNKYDGSYQAVGVFSHPTAGDRAIDRVKVLSTVNGTTVNGELGDLGGSNYFMDIKINGDNTVTLTPKGVTPNIDQSYGPNYYDPATKSFHLHYSYNTAAPRIVKEVLTLK